MPSWQYHHWLPDLDHDHDPDLDLDPDLDPDPDHDVIHPGNIIIGSLKRLKIAPDIHKVRRARGPLDYFCSLGSE